MTLRSRSCVIGRGVVTFSICSAMALASKTPTQIGSTRWPSVSRRMMIGMLVIGSTIRPLIVISICMIALRLRSSLSALALRLASLSAVQPVRNLGRGVPVKHGLAAQAVRVRAGDAHRHDRGRSTPGRLRGSRPCCRSSGPRAPSRAGGSWSRPGRPACVRPTAAYSSPWMSRWSVLQRHDAARLLVLGHVVGHPLERQRVRALAST